MKKTIEDFIGAAEDSNSTVEVMDSDGEGTLGPLRYASSAPWGGCGIGGCQCSPGLWVAATDGVRSATASFGRLLEEGGAEWNSGHIDDWECLLDWCNIFPMENWGKRINPKDARF